MKLRIKYFFNNDLAFPIFRALVIRGLIHLVRDQNCFTLLAATKEQKALRE